MSHLRLRMKVWTDPSTTKRYLVAMAFLRGRHDDVMVAYAMRDDDTRVIQLTCDEWNALPYYYFQEDGAAPRATPRPVDVIL